jgi:hypothetical protein
MTFMTTLKVSSATRDELKVIADREGITLDATVQRLLRSERQRQIGRELANRIETFKTLHENTDWITASNSAVNRALD